MIESGQNIVPKELGIEQESDEKSYEFEIQDEQGRVLGKADVRLSGTPEKIEKRRGEEYRGRTLKKFVISGEKDGQRVDLDVLELANSHQAKITIDEEEERSFGYFYLPPDRVFSPMPKTPQKIATLLHELGHSDQMHGPALEVQKLNLAINGADRPQTLKERLADIPAVLPETTTVVEEIMKQKDFRQIAALEEKIRELNEAIAVQQAELEEKKEKFEVAVYQKYNIAPPFDPETLAKLKLSTEEKAVKTELDIFFGKIKKLFERERQRNDILKRHPEYLDLLKLPSKLLERDADRRAIQWMLEIRRKTGINLLSVDAEIPQKTPVRTANKRPKETTVAEKIFSLMERTKRALGLAAVEAGCNTLISTQTSSASVSSVSKGLGFALNTYEAKTVTFRTASGTKVTPKLPK